MLKLLQINECLNLSTGKIAQQIGETAIAHGWESWIVYSGREKEMFSKSNLIRVGNYVDACLHYINQRFFDNEGLSSSHYTKELILKIDSINPNVIHLHNIHDHWLNYSILFAYLAQKNIPIVWTQHDCWAFTGGGMYFDMLGCNNWIDGCHNCQDKRSIIFNQSVRNFNFKQNALAEIKNLTFVPVSDWLTKLMRKSVQKQRSIVTIHNGIDLEVFKPILKKDPKENKFRIIGVAAVWDARKGLDDFIRLGSLLPSDFEITLVGLDEQQIKRLPQGIIGITKTSNVSELAELYSNSDVFVNPTYSDNFPTTNIEALACGTPVITYRTGGSPEAVDEYTGVVIEQGNIEALVEAIYMMKRKPLSSEACRKRAENLFDKNICFEKYIRLYRQLLAK